MGRGLLVVLVGEPDAWSQTSASIIWLLRVRARDGPPATCDFTHFKDGDSAGKLPVTMREAQMHTTQMIPGSIFGSAYVHEYRADEPHSYWTPEAKRIDFEAVLKALRSALALRK